MKKGFKTTSVVFGGFFVLVPLFQNCGAPPAGSIAAPPMEIQSVAPSELLSIEAAEFSLPNGVSRSVDPEPLTHEIQVLFRPLNTAHKDLYGSSVAGKYTVQVPNVAGALGKAELVQRYLHQSHPSYAKLQLSTAAKVDPRMACGDDIVADGKRPRGKVSQDFSDIAPRAVIVSRGGKKKYLLFGGHINPFNMVGSSLRLVERDCSRPVYSSKVDPRYGMFRSFEWISSVYTRNGKTVYAFANNDWRACTEIKDGASIGCDDPVDGYKKNENNWWWASFTSLVSTDAGIGFRSPSNIPTEYAIAKPSNTEFQRVYKHSKYFNPVGITGFYQSTNVMRNPLDGDYYLITRRQTKAEQDAEGQIQSLRGLCVLRAAHGSDLKAPGSWKSLSQTEPEARFEGNPGQGECQLLNPMFVTREGYATKLSELRHLSYNTYLKKFIGLGVARISKPSGAVSALVLVTSGDPRVTRWDERAVEIVETRSCVPGPCPSSLSAAALGTGTYEIKYANLVDPSYEHLVGSSSFKELVLGAQGTAMAAQDQRERLNFDVTGKKPWLYFSFKTGKVAAGGVSMHSLEIVRMPLELESN